MTDIEQRAHDLAVAYVTESYKAKKEDFCLDESSAFEFGTAYASIYRAILNSLSEKKDYEMP